MLESTFRRQALLILSCFPALFALDALAAAGRTAGQFSVSQGRG